MLELKSTKQSLNNTKIEKQRGNSHRKKEEVSGRKAHTNTRKLNKNAPTITDVFTICPHTFTLLWWRKTSVIVEEFQIELPCVCVGLSPEDLFFFSVNVSPFFSFFCIVLRYFTFHVTSDLEIISTKSTFITNN